MANDGNIEGRVAEALSHVSGGAFDQARALAESILAGDPRHVVAWRIVGVAQRLETADAACKAFEQAIGIDPSDIQTWINLSVLRARQNRFEDAELAARAAVKRNPKHAFAHWHLATILLTRGNFREGWGEYEWRWEARSVTGLRYTPPWPSWTGESLAGRKLLVFAEQGFGDMIQFLRLAPGATALGADVTLKPLRGRSKASIGSSATVTSSSRSICRHL